MKTQNTLAKTNIAILTADISGVSSDGWYQLLPAGGFSARDGRPFDVASGQWFIDAAIAKQFIESTAAVGQPVLIDYNHETIPDPDKPALPQKEAVAAGWLIDPLTQMKWIDNVGLFIRPSMTDDALALINDKKFGFLSAVFPYDPATGHPSYLRMAALTNDPGLTGLQSLAKLSANQLHDFLNPQKPESKSMNELLKAILIALGVLAADDSAEYTDEQLTELATKAGDAINALKTAADVAVQTKTVVEESGDPQVIATDVADIIDGNATEIAEADEIISEAKLHNIDLTVAVPLKAHKRIIERLTALNAADSKLTAQQLIDKARREGRVLAADVPRLLALSKSVGLVALSAEINTRKPIASLSSIQTQSVRTPPKTDTSLAVLSADDKTAARLLGLSDAEMLKRKNGAK